MMGARRAVDAALTAAVWLQHGRMALPGVMSPGHVSSSKQCVKCTCKGQILRAKKELSTVFKENEENMVVRQGGIKPINYKFCANEEHFHTSCRRIQSIASQ